MLAASITRVAIYAEIKQRGFDPAEDVINVEDFPALEDIPTKRRTRGNAEFRPPPNLYTFYYYSTNWSIYII